MLRVFLFILAALLFALSSLTVFKSPDWFPWKFAVLAGEFGYWLAPAAVLAVAVAWFGRGDHPALAGTTVVLGVVALLLFLKPCFQAAQIAASLPEKLTAQFGAIPMTRAPFSVADLFFGRNAPPVAMRTLSVAAGLPLDFYEPVRAANGRPAPCVIVIHGGGWNSGDRTQIPHFNHWLAQRGYAVAAISYRLAPKFKWPAQRDDVLAAIAFLKSRAVELGIDPARFVLLGRSAGGQIAQTVAYTAGDPAIRGVVGLYSPADLDFAYEHGREDDAIKSRGLMRDYLGGSPESARDNYDSASAYLHVTGRLPPTLLLHGENDTLVAHGHSVRLDKRLAEHGVARVFVSMPWATHAFDFNLHGPGGQLTTFSLEWFLGSVMR